jgi:putative endonuclease
MTEKPSPRDRGRLAEDIAAAWLRIEGMQPLDRNRCAADGEVDLVMRDGSTLVFVEVRMRRRGSWSTAAGSIDAMKFRRLRRCAAALARSGEFDWPGRRIRIDVVLLEGDRAGCHLRHLRNIQAPALRR